MSSRIVDFKHIADPRVQQEAIQHLFPNNPDNALAQAITKQIENNANIECGTCHSDILPAEKSSLGVGFAVTDDGSKVCYSCCAEQDKIFMRRSGYVYLYLNEEKKCLTNWPGSLSINVFQIKKGKHNIARIRTDVWFVFEGFIWHGVQLGYSNEIARCKRTKQQWAKH